MRMGIQLKLFVNAYKPLDIQGLSICGAIMFISIKKDGSIYIESSSFIASYNEKGKLNYSIGGRLECA